MDTQAYINTSTIFILCSLMYRLMGMDGQYSLNVMHINNLEDGQIYGQYLYLDYFKI